MAVIGIFALQGDFEKHGKAVNELGHTARYVKDAKTLNSCEKLIIPGGESTTFLKLIDRLGLRNPLIQFAKKKAVFGTCAGLIILSEKVENDTIVPLGLIDMVSSRNAYGRQIDSFIDNIDIEIGAKKKPFEAVFIRAPKIVSTGKGVRVLAKHNNDVVLVAQNRVLAATFHPELTDDLAIHDFFINLF